MGIFMVFGRLETKVQGFFRKSLCCVPTRFWLQQRSLYRSWNCFSNVKPNRFNLKWFYFELRNRLCPTRLTPINNYPNLMLRFITMRSLALWSCRQSNVPRMGQTKSGKVLRIQERYKIAKSFVFVYLFEMHMTLFYHLAWRCIWCSKRSSKFVRLSSFRNSFRLGWSMWIWTCNDINLYLDGDWLFKFVLGCWHG